MALSIALYPALCRPPAEHTLAMFVIALLLMTRRAKRLEVLTQIGSSFSEGDDVIKGQRVCCRTLRADATGLFQHLYPIRNAQNAWCSIEFSPFVRHVNTSFQASVLIPRVVFRPGFRNVVHSTVVPCPCSWAKRRISISSMPVRVSPCACAQASKSVIASSDNRKWVECFMATMLPQCGYNNNSAININVLGDWLKPGRKALTSGDKSPRLARAKAWFCHILSSA